MDANRQRSPEPAAGTRRVLHTYFIYNSLLLLCCGFLDFLFRVAEKHFTDYINTSSGITLKTSAPGGRQHPHQCSQHFSFLIEIFVTLTQIAHYFFSLHMDTQSAVDSLLVETFLIHRELAKRRKKKNKIRDI